MNSHKGPTTREPLPSTATTEALVGQLVADLHPMRPYRPGRAITAALLGNLAATSAILLYGDTVSISFDALGPAGFLWNVRVAAALVVFVLVSILVVDVAVPRATSLLDRRASRIALLCFFLVTVVGFILLSMSASLPPDIHLKRAHCLQEGVIIVCTAAATITLALRRSLTPHRDLLAAALFLWTALFTMIVMDITCLVSLSHSLLCHALPALCLSVPAAYLIRSRLRRL